MERNKWGEWMQRDLDGDLTEVEKERLMKHLARSPEDTRLYKELRYLSDELSQLPKVKPPVSLVDSLLAEIEQEEEIPPEEPRSRRFARWRSAPKVITGMVTLLVAGFAVLLVNGWVDRSGKPSFRSQMTDTLSHHPQSSATTASGTKKETQSTVVSSPDNNHHAIWQGNRYLIVQAKTGNIRFNEVLPDVEQTPNMKWLSEQRLFVTYQNKKGQKKKLTIDVVKGKKVN